MILVGIAGPKRSGKNTLAAGLSRALGVSEDSFAGPMRRFIAELTGLDAQALDTRKEAPLDWLGGVTPRRMLQTVGTEWGRQMIHPEIWVRALLARLPKAGAIISDVRFPNEAQAILARGGVIFRLSRPGLAADDPHLSERPLPDHLVTVELVNCSTPERLVEAALACLEDPRRALARVSMDPPPVAWGRNPVAQDTGD